MAVDKQQLLIQLKASGISLTKGQLKQLEKQVDKTSGSMGGMAGAIAGATIALYAASRAFKAVVGTGKEFQQKMADVKAISGATGEEFKALEKNARALGASTVFTASQVGELQKEFAKLGFTASEIVNVTEGTLALASAVGADLADAAATAGTTLRGFGMDVSETGRVTDVMALSFSKSALDLQKFSDSMKYVAPIAKLAGVSLEGTTAILGSLANAGIDGSMAGTSLRRILLEAGKAGSKLANAMGGPITSMEDFQEKLKNLRDNGFDPLTEGADLVGKRAVTAFAIMLEGAGKTDKLTEALKKAGGAAQEMADIQLNTLEGDLRKLSSATDELHIKMFNLAEGPLRDVTQGMTNFTNSIGEGDIISLTKGLETAAISYGVFKVGVGIATVAQKGFAFALSKTPWGIVALGLGAVTTALSRYYKTFETEADKQAKATKIQDDYNDSVEELADILGTAFTLDEAIDEFHKWEQAMGDVDAQITMLEEDIKAQTDTIMYSNIMDDKKYKQLMKNLEASIAYRAELEETKNATQEEMDIYSTLIEQLEDLVEVQKKVTQTKPPPIGESVELTDEEKKAQEKNKWINMVADIERAVDEEKAERQQQELERLIELQYMYGEIGGTILANWEQHSEAAQTAIDGFEGAIGAWEQKNQAEFDITRKKLDKEDKEELKILKNSDKYKKASTKAQQKMEEDFADERTKVREGMEDKIATKEYEVAQWRYGLAIATSIIDTANAVMAALVSIPPNVPLSIIMGITGAIQTGIIIANKPKKPAQFGLNEVIDTPTTLSVAEAGPELVQVTPLGGDMSLSGGGGATINISFEGNVLSDDFIELEAIPKIREAVLRGESLS